jgi:hypothetical protein
MLLDLLYESEEKNQPVFTNPVIKIDENKRAPLCTTGGITLIRNLAMKLNIADKINEGIKILKKHKPYHESDHIFNFLYNFLTGGDAIRDIEKRQGDVAFLKMIGADSIPDPTTAGDFLFRFNEENINNFQSIIDRVQDDAFSLLHERKRKVATIDADSSIHQVYGEKKEGADFAYDKTYSYNAYYMTLMETGDILYQDLREGNTYSSEGTVRILPGVIDRVKKNFSRILFRGDSAFYSKEIVNICDDKKVDFSIVADQTKPLMNKVMNIPKEEWYPFIPQRNRCKKNVKEREKRRNNKMIILRKYKKVSKRKGPQEISSFYYKPTGWSKEYRFVVKRTEIIDKQNQLYLDEDLCKYTYHIIVTNSERKERNVIKIAQGRGNQENYIKDFKDGLGLSHIPTGFFNANKIYFKIAALAWNLKTWLLNLIQSGSGAIIRFKRFLVDWIFKACTVADNGKNRIVIRMDKGEYFSRYNKAFGIISNLNI